MKNPFRKSGDSASIESELKRLADRKSEADRKRSEVLQALEDARQARRDVLDGEQASIDGATAKLKALTIEAADLAEMIEDFDAAINAANERFRQAREHEARQTAAAQLEAIAAKIDAQTAEFEKAVKAIAKAARAMLSAIPDGIGTFPMYAGDRPGHRQERGNYASGREAVSAVVADALAAEIPELFDAYSQVGFRRALFCPMNQRAIQPSYRANEPTEPLPAREVVNALIVDRLKTRAQAIRSGEEAASLNDVRYHVPAPRVKSVDVIATEHVMVVLPDGVLSPVRLLTVGQAWSLTPDQATKLVATGAFIRVGTTEANSFIAKREDTMAKRMGVGSAVPKEAYRDLGDPLGLRTAEAEEDARLFG